MERKILVEESAFAQFSRGCKPDSDTKAAIKAALEALKTNPEKGQRIPFNTPDFYQLAVGEYRIHYIFDERQVKIVYIGILGRC